MVCASLGAVNVAGWLGLIHEELSGDWFLLMLALIAAYLSWSILKASVLEQNLQRMRLEAELRIANAIDDARARGEIP